VQSSEIDEIDRLFRLSAPTFSQDRARKTYEALVAAAAETFAKRGFDDTQTPDIAAKAGVAVGTFYRYFADKREIFLEIMKRHMAQSYREVMGELSPERFVGIERRATIDHALSVLLENVTRIPALERVFLQMSLRDREIGELRHRVEEVCCERLAALIVAICPSEQVPDPPATAYVIYTAVVECAIHIAGFRGPAPLERERALAALTEMVYRAMFGQVEPDAPAAS
jgi:AcrR family transcriptional regulator